MTAVAAAVIMHACVLRQVVVTAAVVVDIGQGCGGGVAVIITVVPLVVVPLSPSPAPHCRLVIIPLVPPITLLVMSMLSRAVVVVASSCVRACMLQ